MPAAAREVLKALAEETGARFVLVPQAAGVHVFPVHAGQDWRLGEQLARRVGGVALHLLVHDSDVFAYQLHESGTCTDRYASDPDSFGPVGDAERGRWAGHPDVVARAWGVPEQGSALARALTVGNELFAELLLERFARVLGLRGVATSYEELTAAVRLPSGAEHVPPLPAPSRPRSTSAATPREAVALHEELEALRASGKLLATLAKPGVKAKGVPPAASVVAGPAGYFVAWRAEGRSSAPQPLQYWTAPWRTPALLRAPTPPHAELAAGDPASRRAVVVSRATGVAGVVDLAQEAGVSVWEAKTPAARYALTARGERVVVCAGTRLQVVDAATGRSEGVLELGPPANQLGVHPSGAWAVVQTYDGVQVVGLEPLRRHSRLASFQVVRPDVAVTPPRAMGFAFSDDGAWLLVPTDAGLHVYAWESVLGAAGTLPEPRWNIALPRSRAEASLAYGFCLVARHDAARQRVLFGGTGGRLHALSLADGAVRTLVELPGDASLFGLWLAHDGRTLATSERPWTPGNDGPAYTRIYDLAALG